MPTATDSRRARAHQRNLAAVAGGVTSVVASAALGADIFAIDTWYWGVTDALISHVSTGYAQSRRIGMDYYRRDALAHGVDLSPIPSSFNRDKAVTGLRVTGPVAFKQAIRAGASPAQALQTMSSRMSGAAQRLTLAGDRDVFDTTFAMGQIVGWRRRLGGRGCGFCAMLASRGAVYQSQQRASTSRFGTPYHDHCVPSGTLVSGPTVEKGFRRWYEGELVIIHTADGDELAITPNHPVLADRGWVRAGRLRVGDDVIRRCGLDGKSLDVPDEDDVPSPIEQIWRPRGVDALAVVPVAAEDFHGDGVGTQGDVEVVGTDGFFSYVLDGSFCEPHAQLVRAGTVAAGSDTLPAESALGQVLLGSLAAADGGMEGSNLLAALLGAEATHPQRVGLRFTATVDAGLGQPARHCAAADPEALADAQLRLSGPVGRDSPGIYGDALPWAGTASLRPRFDPASSQCSPDDFLAMADLGRRLRERLSGGIEASRVVELRRVDYSGHVHNLQTIEGWYSANRMIVSNCRCYPEPLYEVEDDEPADVRELQRQWERVTAGHSGRDAVRVWRRHWERVAPRRPVLELARPVAEAVDPASKMTVAQLKAVARANGVPNSVLGTRKADIIRGLRDWEGTYEVKLSGLPEFKAPRPVRPGFEGVPPLGVPAPGPTLSGSALDEWADYFKHDLEQRRFQLVNRAGATPAEGVRVADLRVTIGAADGSYSGYVVHTGTAWRIDGTSYLIEHGPGDFGAPWVSRALKELREAHAAIPAARQANNSYTILSGTNPADVHWRKVYSPDHVSAMTAGQGHINVWTFGPKSRIRDKVDLLRHETGHNLDHMVGPGKSGSRSLAWDQAAQADVVSAGKIQDLVPTNLQARDLAKVQPSRAWPKGVTDYGRSSQVEDWAESVMLYQLGPIATGRLPGAAAASLRGVRLPPGARAITADQVLYFRDIYPNRAKILDKLLPDVAKAQKAEIAALRAAAAKKVAAAPDLSKMPIAQLRTIARDRGITIPTGARKADIVDLLETPPAELAARVRQAAIDDVRKVANLLAEVEELVSAEASKAALRSRITASATRLGVPTRVRTALLRAVDSGDPDKIRAAVARLVKGAKLEPVGVAGDVGRFTGKTHTATSGSIREGAHVEVIRPGFYATVNGERILIAKAVVDEITEKEAREILARAAKKAAATPTDLSKLTVTRLRALAKERGVAIPSGAKKADIITAIRVADEGADIPAAPVARDWRDGLDAAVRDLAAIADSPLLESRSLGGGLSAGVHLEVHEGGTVVRKSFPPGDHVRAARDQVDAERLGSLVANAIGVDAPAVVRVDGDTILVRHVNGKTWAEQSRQSAPRDLIDSNDGRLVGLTDVLIANPDRNSGNWMTTDGGIAAIDHGLAFSGRFSAGASSPFAGYLVNKAGNNWADGIDISPGDMTVIRFRLESIRSDFTTAGRTKWFDDMMERFDALESRATGTVSRLS